MTILTQILSSITEFITTNSTTIITISGILIISLIVFGVIRSLTLRNTKQLLYIDKLTGIHKSEFLEKNFSNIVLSKDKDVTFFYINIDNFKNYNDIFGYNAANRLLVEFASRLMQMSETVYRVHSDRFIMIHDISEDDMRHFTKTLLKKLKEPYFIEAQSLTLTVSIGTYQLKDNSLRYHDCIYRSELALEKAKLIGKDQMVEYSDDLKSEHHNAFEMFQVIKKALNEESFHMEFQPIVNTKSELIVGFESLLRYEDKHKMVFPAQIISFAERFNLIEEIDKFVIKKSFETYKAMKNENAAFEFLAVNISSSEINDNNFIAYLKKMLKKYQVDPKDIVIEFTETADPNKLENEFSFINTLRKIGFKVAIDDFGSGYSSMYRLSKNPLDRIKIDKSFVQDILHSDSNQKLIRSMVNLAEEFDLEVICEGVETKEEFDFVKSLGIDYVQGYYFFKALRYEDAITTLANQNSKHKN